MNVISTEAQKRLETEQNIWMGSVRPDGRPHLAPIWFVWEAGKIYVSTDPKSVKAHNIQSNPRVVMALESGLKPVICEGSAETVSAPWPEEIIAAFLKKYEWDITKEEQYNQLIAITPDRWLVW
ncbi:MAG: pyridoxamine 5'-phosphate oxidase [Chloroflexota bacterium]|nr:MAG: pyridoxamine 5'-phosphate oxidase [Chloroflexota bacterium]